MVLALEFQQGMYSNNAYDTFKPKLKDTQKKSISEIDQQLYDMYGLSEEEIVFIEDSINQ